MKRFFLMAVMMGLANTSLAGSIVLNIDDEGRQFFLAEGSSPHHWSGPLLYDGVQIGTATALYVGNPSPNDPDPGVRVYYMVIDVEIGTFSYLINTTVMGSGASEFPAALIDKTTGVKLLGGTLAWSYGGGISGLQFTFTWED
jgi:hypothetical protein